MDSDDVSAVAPAPIDLSTLRGPVMLHAWAEKTPPRHHWVMATYTVLGTLDLLKTCRRGCCVHAPWGTQMLPRYWRDATPEEIAAGDWTERAA